MSTSLRAIAISACLVFVACESTTEFSDNDDRCNGTIGTGTAQTDNTDTVIIENGTVVGGNIQLLQGGTARVADVRVDGDIQIEQNMGAQLASGNVVFGNFQVFANTGGVTLLNNAVSENLQCKENVPAPTGSGNTAGSKEDQCAML